LDGSELCAHGADAALVTGLQPAKLWNEQAVEPDVVGKLGRRIHRSLRAGNHMDLQVRHQGESLQQRFGRRAEIRLRLVIFPVGLPRVDGQ
jgi:hypothetical protein